MIDAIITTGGTGFTGRDVTPEAVEPLFEKKMDAFSALFLVVSFPKIGTSAIQSRATAGVAGSTYIFCLPGSPGACRDAWDEILVHQLDYRYEPCNFVEILPRLDEHLRRPKATGAGRSQSKACHCEAKRRSNPALEQQFVLPSASRLQLQIPVLAHHRPAPALVRLAAPELEAGLLIDVAGCGQHAVGP